MRDVSSEEETVLRPAICVALDEAIEEANLTNIAIAQAIETSEQNVGRWRRNKQPSRDTVADIEEKALNKPLGYVSRLAGYFAETPENDLLAMIEETTLLSDGYRRIILRAVEDAVRASAEERAEQEEWRSSKRKSVRKSTTPSPRKTTSAIRRSRKA